MSVKPKTETIEEYVARGGSIKKLPLKETIRQPDAVRKTVAGEPAVFMSLEEADLFYGEVRKGSKPKKEKPSLKVDLSALPEALRTKFVNKLKGEVNGEEEQNKD